MSTDDMWKRIAPGRLTTRVIAMAGAGETLMKARLSLSPSHPRALVTLLEAVALWQGNPVRAALFAADKDGMSDSSLYRDAAFDFGGRGTSGQDPSRPVARIRRDVGRRSVLTVS